MRSTYMWQLRTLLNKVLPIHKKLVARNPALNLVDKSNLDQFNMLDAHITASQPDASYTSINNIRISDMPLKIAANTLDELLAQHDIAFVNLAYRTILGRAPDTEGLSYYLKRLRNGISKLEIITQLRKSAEGKNHDTSLTGLDKAIKLHQYLKTPLLGAMLRFFGFNPVERDIQQNLRAIDPNLR